MLHSGDPVWLLIERDDQSGVTIGVYSTQVLAQQERARLLSGFMSRHADDYRVVPMALNASAETG